MGLVVGTRRGKFDGPTAGDVGKKVGGELVGNVVFKKVEGEGTELRRNNRYLVPQFKLFKLLSPPVLFSREFWSFPL